MSYQGSLNAVCFGDLKQAALYFNRVIPVAFHSMQGTGGGVVVKAPEEVPGEVMASLIYGQGAPDHTILEFLQKHWQPFISKIYRRLPRSQVKASDSFSYDLVRDLYLQNHSTPTLGSIRNDFADLSKGLGFKYSAVVLAPSEDDELSYSEAYVVVSLCGLSAIDVSKASWEQIVSLREDEVMAKKLRRLRLFVFEKYSGKSRAYIEDDLARRLEDYELARKSLGFESVVGTISVVLDSKALLTSLSVGVVGALIGGPTVGIGSAVALEVSKVSVEISKKNQAIRNLEIGHDLAFIASAQKKLPSNR